MRLLSPFSTPWSRPGLEPGAENRAHPGSILPGEEAGPFRDLQGARLPLLFALEPGATPRTKVLDPPLDGQAHAALQVGQWNQIVVERDFWWNHRQEMGGTLRA